MANAVNEVARKLRLKLTPDPYPEEGYFVRSDQYPFVKQGIPAVFLGEGLSADKASANYTAKNYTDKNYHQPSDDMSQQWNFEAAAISAQLHLLVTEALASVRQRPTLDPDSFLGRRFPRSAPSGR
jgi:Zn-dependent M28 family amino/carboxypeptidase